MKPKYERNGILSKKSLLNYHIQGYSPNTHDGIYIYYCNGTYVIKELDAGDTNFVFFSSYEDACNYYLAGIKKIKEK